MAEEAKSAEELRRVAVDALVEIAGASADITVGPAQRVQAAALLIQLADERDDNAEWLLQAAEAGREAARDYLEGIRRKDVVLEA